MQPGDILFQNRDLTPFGQAVTAVYRGWKNHRINHCGLVMADGRILEAVAAGVVETPLEEFLALSSGQAPVLTGRLVERWRVGLPATLAWARTQLGRPYNRSFSAAGPGFYCSQLLCEAFKVGCGQAVLPESPMNFLDEATGAILPFWQQYYEQLNLPVPQGQPGSHPAVLSLSANLTVQLLRTVTQIKRAP